MCGSCRRDRSALMHAEKPDKIAHWFAAACNGAIATTRCC